MKRIGIEWGTLRSHTQQKYRYIGIDHTGRKLGDNLHRSGIEFGIVKDEHDDANGFRLWPYYMGPSRSRVTAYASAIISLVAFILSIIIIIKGA